MHLSIKQSINHFINPPIKQFRTTKIHQSINQLIHQSGKVKPMKNKFINQSINQPINLSTNQLLKSSKI